MSTKNDHPTHKKDEPAASEKHGTAHETHDPAGAPVHAPKPETVDQTKAGDALLKEKEQPEKGH